MVWYGKIRGGARMNEESEKKWKDGLQGRIQRRFDLVHPNPLF